MKGHFYLALTDDPMVDVLAEQGSMEEVGEDAMERMTTPSVFQQITAFGIDRKRLADAMDSKDAWGKLVHAFEYVTALSVLLDNWPDERLLESVPDDPMREQHEVSQATPNDFHTRPEQPTTGLFPMHEGGR